MQKDETVNAHHLIPRSYGGTAKYAIHKICHSKIHAAIPEKDLARVYNTFEQLRKHPEIAKFIEWVRKRPSDLLMKHRRSR